MQKILPLVEPSHLTGGDWKDLSAPLVEVKPYLTWLYVWYVCFMSFAAVNVVIGMFAEKAARAAFVTSADASALRKGAADQAAARQREVDNSRLLARQIHEVRPRRFHVRGEAARS